MSENFDLPKQYTTPAGQEFVLRYASITDARALIKYLDAISYESNFLSFGPNELRLTLEQEREIIKNSSSQINHLYVLAIFDDAIAGVLTVTGSSKTRLQHIGEMGVSVRKKHWGNKIGTTLLEFMLDWASQNPVIRKITLLVQVNNTKAIHMYKKYGFEIEGTIRRGLKIRDDFFDTYLMGKLFD